MLDVSLQLQLAGQNVQKKKNITKEIKKLKICSFIHSLPYGLHAFCLYIYLIKLNWRNQFKSSILYRLLDGTVYSGSGC